jgi:hypothetical protein
MVVLFVNMVEMTSFRFFEKKNIRKFYELKTFHTFASVKKLFKIASCFNPSIIYFTL